MMLIVMVLFAMMMMFFLLFLLVDFDLSGGNWFSFLSLILLMAMVMMFNVMVLFVMFGMVLRFGGIDCGGRVLLMVSDSVVGPVHNSSINFLEGSVFFVTKSIEFIELGFEFSLLPLFFLDNSFLSLIFYLFNFGTLHFFGSGLTFGDIVLIILLVLSLGFMLSKLVMLLSDLSH